MVNLSIGFLFDIIIVGSRVRSTRDDRDSCSITAFGNFIKRVFLNNHCRCQHYIRPLKMRIRQRFNIYINDF